MVGLEGHVDAPEKADEIAEQYAELRRHKIEVEPLRQRPHAPAHLLGGPQIASKLRADLLQILALRV